jgi:hypothetical protein
MSGKLMAAAAAGVLLLATTAFASAQTRAEPFPYYYGGWGYYGGPTYNYVMPPPLLSPGYYDYAPGYYGPGPGTYYDGWSWRHNGWDW